MLLYRTGSLMRQLTWNMSHKYAHACVVLCFGYISVCHFSRWIYWLKRNYIIDQGVNERSMDAIAKPRSDPWVTREVIRQWLSFISTSPVQIIQYLDGPHHKSVIHYGVYIILYFWEVWPLKLISLRVRFEWSRTFICYCPVSHLL